MLMCGYAASCICHNHKGSYPQLYELLTLPRVSQKYQGIHTNWNIDAVTKPKYVSNNNSVHVIMARDKYNGTAERGEF